MRLIIIALLETLLLVGPYAIVILGYIWWTRRRDKRSG